MSYYRNKWWLADAPFDEIECPVCYYCLHSREREEYDYGYDSGYYTDEDTFGEYCYLIGKPVSRADTCEQWVDRYKRHIFEFEGKLVLLDYRWLFYDFDFALRYDSVDLVDAEQIDKLRARLLPDKSEK